MPIAPVAFLKGLNECRVILLLGLQIVTNHVRRHILAPLDFECPSRSSLTHVPDDPCKRPEPSSVGALSFARIATTLLHERLPWVTTLLYPTASEREECMLAMLFFWVLAALAVVGALVIVWGLYLLTCRWL